MDFDEAHREFLQHHRNRSGAERRRRLDEGHGHAEKLFLRDVWWPAYGHFRFLHPEYEIRDFRDGYRYLDFAYLRDGLKLAIEIDGFNPHVARLSRRDFSDALRRQNHLTLDGWFVLRFSYDDVRERPRECQQIIQQFMGRWLDEADGSHLTFMERAVVRMAQSAGRPLTPVEVSRRLDIGRRAAYGLLRGLVEKGWLQPASAGARRVRRYAVSAKHVVGGP